MAYQGQLADRLRIALDPALLLEEHRMFGGLILLFDGRMLCGTSGENFMFRVGAAWMDEALRQTGARPVQLGDHAPMSGFVLVQGSPVAGVAIDRRLDWCLANQRGLNGDKIERPEAPHPFLSPRTD